MIYDTTYAEILIVILHIKTPSFITQSLNCMKGFNDFLLP